MDGRVSRGSWKRGGRGGNDNFGGEHRGRGRGGHHRGRGKRDHHRGRGRGGGGHVVDLPAQDHDEGDRFEEADDRMKVFSRRKLESNWDRYAESELLDQDDDTPTQRGTDYHVLLESAGDSFTQFRFSEEKDWEMDPFTASQMSAVFLDLPALAHSLQQVPLHQRLNLEAELVQVSTPAELPVVTLTPKQEVPQASKFTPSSTAFRNPGTNQKIPIAAEPLVDDGDEELDQLLSLQKPDSDDAGMQPISGADEESAASERACEDVAPKTVEEKTEEVKDKDVAPLKSAAVREEMTEEDLEDWLDSMIS
ncbi:cell death regulator Aven isoform X2 [Melanotaenia boesemani]|uniref:cell death regulator Aven isoform X2 n=1 Tax=Melanotaenia boesemani TaxID=1250792 RepID=UPI001C046EF0|nr:cell death regulator Aven isoform X2 [Melanotaenia boesemani]